MKEKARSIRLPERIWDALDADAERCRRSSQKHLEALLVSFYNMDNVEIQSDSLEMIGKLMPNSKRKISVTDTGKQNNKKKKAS